jgi:hypothetical protein
MSAFAAVFIALYVGHHVGDYWVQTDAQAAHKGDAGLQGHMACLAHVSAYVVTQLVCVDVTIMATGARVNWAAVLTGLLVSGVTHYAADRREHGLMFRLARLLPGKVRFLELGKPRNGRMIMAYDFSGSEHVELIDSPSLGTGAWALDQSWHLFFGVFIPALIVGAWH